LLRLGVKGLGSNAAVGAINVDCPPPFACARRDRFLALLSKTHLFPGAMRFMHDQTDVIALMLTFLTPAMIASVAVVSTACREAVNSMDALLDATVTLGEGIQPLVALGFDARRDEYLCSPLWKEVTERVRWPWVKVGKLVLQDIHREVIPGCDGEVDPRDLKDTIVWILGRLREVSQLVIRMQFPIHLDEQGCLPFKAQESVTKLSLVSDGAHSSINRWLRYLTRAGTAPLRALTHVNIITLGIRMCSVIRMEMPAPVNTFMFGGSSLREMELTHAILFAPICLESIHHPVSQLPHLAALRKLVLTSCVVYLRWMLSLPRLTELNMHSCTISAGTDTAAEGRSLVVREAQLHTSPLCMEQLVPHMHTSYLRIWPERVVEFNAHTWHALLHAQPPVLDIDTCKWDTGRSTSCG